MTDISEAFVDKNPKYSLSDRFFAGERVVEQGPGWKRRPYRAVGRSVAHFRAVDAASIPAQRPLAVRAHLAVAVLNETSQITVAHL